MTENITFPIIKPVNFKNKALIIFDFDGTLINSIPDLTLSLNRMLAFYHLPPLTIEQVTPFIGNGARPLVQRAIDFSTKDIVTSKIEFEEAFQRYFKSYLENSCVETYAYPGVIDTLKYLKKKGYKLAICTNKPSVFIEPILKKLDIKEYFDYWIGEDSLPEKKPSASPLLYLAAQEKVDINQCLMVGDSKNDIYAAHNANIESVGVSYGYNYNEHIADYNPTLIIDNFSDLKDCL